MAETGGDTTASEVMTHPAIEVPEELRSNIFVTTLNKLYNWGRKSSIWPLSFGLACCAIEMICAAASRYDWGRFGMDITRPSPRQADLLIVSGTVTKKMVPQIVRIYNQMAQPKYVISMGACATGGGPFKEGYNVVPGIDKFIPVDVYVPGCPPTPEALIHGFVKLHEKVQKQSFTTVPWYHSKESDLIPVPILGPDLYDSRRIPEIKERLAQRRQEAVVVPEEIPEAVEPRNKGPVLSPTPTAPAGPTKLTPEEIEARRQAALEKRGELKERAMAAREAVPEGVDAKQYKIEATRVQALERKLAQAERGEGKQTPEQVREKLAEARERLAALTGGAVAPVAEETTEAVAEATEATEPVEATEAATEEPTEVAPTAPVAGDSDDALPAGVDAKQVKIEAVRIQALERRLAQAEKGEGKHSPDELRQQIAAARERLEQLKAGG